MFHNLNQQSRCRCGVLLGALLLLVIMPFPALGQTTDRPGVLGQINSMRIANGLAPLAVNPLLEQAAQKHSDDMSAKGFVDHTGSDGSMPADRAADAHFPSWSTTRVLAENVYAGSHGFNEAMDYFMQDDAQRRNLLSPRYREIGIGIASAPGNDGAQRVYWTLLLGSQPNVLPIFINDGATLINVPQVAIHLTQEEAIPGGEGTAIGNAIEVRVSSDATFQDATWIKWESLIPFTFSSAPGLKTVHVQFRDGGGRVAISTASIQYDPKSTPQVTPVAPGINVTADSSLDATPALTPSPFATVAPVRTIQPGAIAPQVTVQVVSTARTPTPTSIMLVVVPAVTPGVRPTPTVELTPQVRTQTQHPDEKLPEWLLPAYLIAQATVIALGLAGFFRMKMSQ